MDVVPARAKLNVRSDWEAEMLQDAGKALECVRALVGGHQARLHLLGRSRLDRRRLVRDCLLRDGEGLNHDGWAFLADFAIPRPALYGWQRGVRGGGTAENVVDGRMNRLLEADDVSGGVLFWIVGVSRPFGAVACLTVWVSRRRGWGRFDPAFAPG